MSRKLLVVLSAAIGTLVLVPSADAITTLPVWKCRASPSYASVSDGNRVEPVVANGNINTANGANPDLAQCAPAEAGAGNIATQLGIPQDLLGARTAGAATTITPELGRAIDQKAAAGGEGRERHAAAARRAARSRSASTPRARARRPRATATCRSSTARARWPG